MKKNNNANAKKPKPKPKRKRSKANGRKAGKQPLVLGEETHRLYARLPDSEVQLMNKRIAERRAKSVAEYIRDLVNEDCARLRAS